MVHLYFGKSEVVNRVSQTQIQMGDNFNELTWAKSMTKKLIELINHVLFLSKIDYVLPLGVKLLFPRDLYNFCLPTSRKSSHYVTSSTNITKYSH